MSYRLEIDMPGLPPTENAKRAKHWRKRHDSDVIWKLSVKVELGRKAPPAPLERARVICIRRSSVCPDYDGIVSSFKPLIDSLVENKVLVGDRMDQIVEHDYRWEKAPRSKGNVTVIVESLP